MWTYSAQSSEGSIGFLSKIVCIRVQLGFHHSMQIPAEARKISASVGVSNSSGTARIESLWNFLRQLNFDVDNLTKKCEFFLSPQFSSIEIVSSLSKFPLFFGNHFTCWVIYRALNKKTKCVTKIYFYFYPYLLFILKTFMSRENRISLIVIKHELNRWRLEEKTRKPF